MKQKTIKSAFFSGKLWSLLFIIIYILYAWSIVIFSQQIGLAMDIAESGSATLFREYLYNICLIAVSQIAFYFVYKLFEAKYLQHIMMNMRNTLFSLIINKRMPDYLKIGSSTLSSRLINDTRLLEQNYISPSITLMKESILAIFSLAALIQLNMLATMFILVFSFLPVLLPKILTNGIRTRMGAFTVEMGKFTEKTLDFLSGFEVFKNYNAEDYVFSSYLLYNEALAKSKRRAFIYLDFLTNAVAMSSIFISIGVLIAGMFLAISGYLTIGEVFAISFISSGISGPISNITNALSKINGARVFANDYNELLTPKQKLEPIKTIQNAITVNNSTLTVDKPILKQISCRFEKGKKYAIVGGSGSGKSTLIKLILGYFDAYDGEVIFDQIPLSKIDSDSLYEQISYVPQKASFFYGSLNDNFTMFNENSDCKLVSCVINNIGLSKIVSKLPNGMESIIEANAANFSGGEAQRIAIARALIQKKPILILDESTSALDKESFVKIERNLLSNSELTLISVTHRLTSEVLSLYDTIFVIKDGELVEVGTFDELIALDGVFCGLYECEGN